MKRAPVRSGNVRSIGYDSAKNTLHIEFNSRDARMPGRVYEYAGVPPDAHLALINATSIGSHFAKYIKPHFPAKIVSGPPVNIPQPKQQQAPALTEDQWLF